MVSEGLCGKQGINSVFVAVDPKETRRRVPSCDFEADRAEDVTWNIRSRGLDEAGAVHPELTSPESVDFWCASLKSTANQPQLNHVFSILHIFIGREF